MRPAPEIRMNEKIGFLTQPKAPWVMSSVVSLSSTPMRHRLALVDADAP
jgi:hypothetical protein